MCGIFGVLSRLDISPQQHSQFSILSAQMNHRGPDGYGEIQRARVLMGMRRLSIMDPVRGNQPLWSNSGAIGVLGNGEIYNSNSLRRELENRGHSFISGSDMEVIPGLFEEFGLDGIARLEGMFAIAILDTRTSEVIVARDPMGEKPLSIFQGDDCFWFSSEQLPLIRAGIVQPKLEKALIPEYLAYGFVPEPGSIISGVHKVPPGHAITFHLPSGMLQMAQFAETYSSSYETVLTPDTLHSEIVKAVTDCCQSDVPIGIALSGGLDSSMVTAIASKESRDLMCFTIGYEGFEHTDESQQALELAEELGLECRVTRLERTQVAQSFAELCVARDEPIGDLAGPAYDALARTARDAGVPVLLTGQGGDELFFGYPWIRELAIREANRKGPYGSVMKALQISKPKRVHPIDLYDWAVSGAGIRTSIDLSRWHKIHDTEDSRGIPLFEFQRGYGNLRRSILSATGVDIHSIDPIYFSSDDDPSLISQAFARATMSSYLLVNGLAQVDRLTMRHSVEARTPLVSQRLVRLVLNQENHETLLQRPAKSIMREVAGRELPSHILNRPKRGFTPPMRDWLRAIWDEYFLEIKDSALVDSGIISGQGFERTIRRPFYRSGRINQVSLRLATLELWARGVL